jgi:hypothetical protein
MLYGAPVRVRVSVRVRASYALCVVVCVCVVLCFLITNWQDGRGKGTVLAYKNKRVGGY